MEGVTSKPTIKYLGRTPSESLLDAEDYCFQVEDESGHSALVAVPVARPSFPWSAHTETQMAQVALAWLEHRLGQGLDPFQLEVNQLATALTINNGLFHVILSGYSLEHL